MNEVTISMDRFENLIEAEIKLMQIKAVRRDTPLFEMGNALLAILGPVQQKGAEDDA